MIRNTEQLGTTEPRRVALDCMEAGISAVLPSQIVGNTVSRDANILEIRDTEIDLSEYERLFLVGGGKGSSLLARELERILDHEIDGGVVSDTDPEELERIETVEASHPTPDESSLEAGRRVLEYASEADEDDLLIFVVTGGGSSLLSSPVEGIELDELVETNDALVRSGASIHEINAVRKHISRLKGGKLAVASHPARTVSLIVSDVVGDDLSVIASGPTSPDESTYRDALETVESYNLEETLPESVVEHIERGISGELEETPGSGSPVFEGVSNVVLANNLDALISARETAGEHGYNALILSSVFEGESRQTARFHASIVREVVSSDNPVEPPCVLVSGGETTVELSENDDSRGGPNQEFVLSFLLELVESEHSNSVTAGAVDTDGIDGNSEYAGSLSDVKSLDEVENPREFLRTHDSSSFFERTNDAIYTGETATNVSDLRVLVVPELEK